MQRFFSSLTERVYLIILIFLVLALLLIKGFLFSGLWHDESISWWVIKDGFWDTAHRAIYFQGQSPLYYWFLWLFKQLGASSEFLLRVPSIVAIGVSCFLIYKLAHRFSDQETALLALLLFFTIDGVGVALSVRPYAVALLFSVTSMVAMLQWIDTDDRRWRFLYIGMIVLTGYAHYLFLGIVAVQAVYLLLINSQNKKQVAKQFLLALCIAGVFLLPGIYQLILLASRHQELSFAQRPTWQTFLAALFPGHIAVSLIVALLCAGIFCAELPLKRSPFSFKMPVEKTTLKFLLLWYFIPPFLLFCYSTLSPNSLFMQRYFLWYVPALVLLFSVVVRAIEPQNARRTVMIVLGLFLLLRELDRRWPEENWALAAKIVEQESLAPVFAYVGFIEADRLSSQVSREQQEYLNAPFSYYHITRQPIPLGSNFEGETQRLYFENVVKPLIKDQRSFSVVYLERKIYRPDGMTFNVGEYYTEFFSKQGFRAEPLISSGAVRALKFIAQGTS